MKHYVYKQTRDTGEYYFGVHSTGDINDGYAGSGKKFKRKYDSDPLRFTKQIILFASSRQDIEEFEELLVDEDMLRDPLCLNLMTGGNCGVHSAESRAKISKAKMGMKFSEEAKANMSKARRLSEKTKGIKHTEKSKAKMRVFATGRKMTPKARANMSLAKQNMSKETKAKMSKSAKARWAKEQK